METTPINDQGQEDMILKINRVTGMALLKTLAKKCNACLWVADKDKNKKWSQESADNATATHDALCPLMIDLSAQLDIEITEVKGRTYKINDG